MSKARGIKRVVALGLCAIMLGTFLTPMATKAGLSVPLSADISADGEDINGGKELVYNAAKNDTDNPYLISYTGELQMGTVWTQLDTLRSIYITWLGNPASKWQERVLEGDFKISFKVDPNYVSVDSAFITKEAVQAQYELNNADNNFKDYMKCYDVSYNSGTGVFEALFRLETNGTPGMQAGVLDDSSFKPASLMIKTPEGAFYVKASDFEAEESFTMQEPHVSGTIDMKGVDYPAVLPVTFNGTGVEPVTLNMENSKTFGLKIVDNYGLPGEVGGDDTLVIFRTGDTGETAAPYIRNTASMNLDGTYGTNGKYPWMYDLDIELDGTRLTQAQIDQLEWTVEGVAGYPSFFGGSIIGATSGSKVITARKAGIVKITAKLGDATDSIHIVVPGDVNRDGSVNTLDKSDIEKMTMSGVPSVTDSFTSFTADMNGDYLVNTQDKSIVEDMFVGNIEPSN